MGKENGVVIESTDAPSRQVVLDAAIAARRALLVEKNLGTQTEARDGSTLRSPSELPATTGHAILRTRTTPPGFRA